MPGEITRTKERTSVLKEYFSQYLVGIRNVKKTTVVHYLDALNNISRRLKDKSVIEHDIYEIMDPKELLKVKEILNNDPDYVALNKRGNNMYSAGLNNYYRFAMAEGLTLNNNIEKLDLPIDAFEPVETTHKTWRRSDALRTQVIAIANYSCELDHNHNSFISCRTQKPYMEAHHLIPMCFQGNFEKSLDVYSNIVCLCPLCHRQIHFGLKEDRKDMALRLFEKRAERMEKCGIAIDETLFLDMTLRDPHEPELVNVG